MSGNSIRELEKIDSTPEVVVLFPDDWAAYSPSLTRLVDVLVRSYRVRVFFIDTGRTDSSALDDAVYCRVKVAPRLAGLLRKLGLYRVFRTIALARQARHVSARAKHVIAVDADGAGAAYLLGKDFHFLSLEIGWHPILRFLVRRHALSIVIQSPERLEYQFANMASTRLPVFFVQNAPPVSGPGSAPPRTRSVDPDRPRFVYLGHALPLHGLRPMLALVASWPGATLTLQGIQPEQSLRLIREEYGGLLAEKRVIIGSEFVAEMDLESFLGNFDIGLCLYELDRRRRRDFNYLSSPSGKMFNYFLSGLPVIASREIGLSPVAERGAGIQVSSNDVLELKAAAQRILANYDRYSAASTAAAAHYDFRKSVRRFTDFLRDGVLPP